MLKYILFFFLCLHYDWFYAQNSVMPMPACEQLIIRHQCPSDIQALIDEQDDDVLSEDLEAYIHDQSSDDQIHGRVVHKLENVPYFYKGNTFHRLKNAILLDRFIQDNNCDKIRVARKWLCKNKLGQWFVLAEQVQSNQSLYPLKKDELDQLLHITCKTGFIDYIRFEEDVPQNLIRDNDGKLVIIDTEEFSFGISCRQAILSILEAVVRTARYERETFVANPFLDINYEDLCELERRRLELESPVRDQIPLILPHNQTYKNELDLYEQARKEYVYYLQCKRIEKKLLWLYQKEKNQQELLVDCQNTIQNCKAFLAGAYKRKLLV